jgi:hypothetical protein
VRERDGSPDELMNDPPDRDRHVGGDDQLLDDPPAPRADYRGGADELMSAPPDRDRHVGGTDQLLDDLPDTDYNLGRFAGYQAGSGVRRFVFIGLGLAAIGAVIAGYFYITYLHENRTPVHAVPLPEGTDISERPRVMSWSSGKARLGLTREPPGLLAIELPDRVLRLADGCDSAQVRLNVVDGETVEMTVLFGVVDEEPIKAE